MNKKFNNTKTVNFFDDFDIFMNNDIDEKEEEQDESKSISAEVVSSKYS